MNLLEITSLTGIVYTFIFGIIAIIYYFRSTNLMNAIEINDWSEITNHYAQIKFLKNAGWKM